MTTENLGNQLNRITSDARALLFNQGELAQLSYGAFTGAASQVQSHASDEIEITFPVGWLPNKQPVTSMRKYSKEILSQRYQFLAIYQLSVNGLV